MFLKIPQLETWNVLDIFPRALYLCFGAQVTDNLNIDFVVIL